MKKSKKSTFFSFISLTILIAIFISGCSKSINKPVVDNTADKQEADLLFPAHEKKDGTEKWGYINSHGTFVIPAKFQSAGDFEKNGLAIIETNSLQGLINKKGEIVLQPTFDYITAFSEGFAIGNNSSKCKIINDKGAVVFSSDYSIGNFTNGFATISKEMGTSGYNYGYIGKNLKIVVDPIYKYAENFSDNKALVKISDTQYGVIDNNFKIISTLNYTNMRSLSEDMIPFMDKSTNKYGYVNTEGKIILPATFMDAFSFKDGFAIVNLSDKTYYSKAGVIDKNGNYVINPLYSSIEYLGNKLFAVTNLSENSGSPYFSPKSLLTANGKQLTGFKYFSITNAAANIFLVTDEHSTYFLDNTGKEINELPKFSGIGSATIMDDLIKGNIDEKLSYVTKAGKIIWQESNSISLSNGLSLDSVKYSPDRSLLIYYPQLKGLTDARIQTTINDNLKKEFQGDSRTSDKYPDGSYAQTESIDFDGSQNKDLLILLKTGYTMPNGAAHGMPIRQYYHINLKTGASYKLSDLFKNNSEYLSKLSSILKVKMEKMNKENDKMYASKDFTLTANQGFYLTKDALNIFFTPYEIASYAEGFPSFSIPYSEINDIINTNGDFWKAVDTTTLASTPEIIETEKDSIVNTAIKNYENTIVDAINSNNFTAVEATLIKDSSLYKSQKALIANLNKQGIKEKLAGFSISKIQWNEDKSVCKVYVNETISIKYPEKEYVDKDFSYVYTLTYSSDNKLLLSDIGK